MNTDRVPVRIQTLDGLRGLAAYLVVVSHLANAGYLPGVLGAGFGKVAVALFYVLSGFFMSHLYFARPLDAQAIRGYVAARISRVLPLFVAVVLVSAAAIPIAGHSVYGFETTQAFLQNLLLIRGTTILWSVPVELQYYLVFLLVWAAGPGRHQIFVLAGLVAIQAALAVGAYSTPNAATTLPFWLHFFLIGHAIVLLLPWLLRHRHWVGWSFLAWGVVIALPLVPPGVRRSLDIPVIPVFSDPVTLIVPPVLIVLALLSVRPFRLLSASWLTWLGRISFSAYLLHWPILKMTPWILGPIDQIPGMAAAFVICATTCVASLSYLFFEEPSRVFIRNRMFGRGRAVAPST